MTISADYMKLESEFISFLDDFLKISWLSECLDEKSIPPPIELEENLRNGVLLARLSNCFAPKIVPVERIFDIEQVYFLKQNIF